MCGESWGKKEKQYIKVSPSSSLPHEIGGRMAGRYGSHYELMYEKTKRNVRYVTTIGMEGRRSGGAKGQAFVMKNLYFLYVFLRHI